MKKLRAAIAATSLLALLAPASASADLEWSSQPLQRLSQARANADIPQVAMDSAGNGVLAWREFDEATGNDRIRVATRTPGGYLSRVEFATQGYASPASGGNASTPRVAVAPDGTAIVVWSRYITGTRLIETRFRSGADGTWSQIETVAQNPEVAVPDVGISPDGNAAIAWVQGQEIRSRTRRPNGTFETAQTVYTLLASGPFPRLGGPLVAVDAAGNQLLTWSDAPTTSSTSPYASEVRAAQRAPGGAWDVKLLTTREPYENIVGAPFLAIHDGTAAIQVYRGAGTAIT
jgi:hypothetical protein